MDTEARAITLFLAEAEKHVRDALMLMLQHRPELRVTGVVTSVEALLAGACRQPPDVILLDWNLPGLHPERLLTALGSCLPETAIVAMSVRPEDGLAAQDPRVHGFLSQQLPAEEFMAALMALTATLRRPSP